MVGRRVTELILHHYDFSNFSEKIRLIMGLKTLRWSSVEIPAYEPKPLYTPLTAGYRRTPALQIGADIYCDTRLIAEVLEARAPVPTLFPGSQRLTKARCETLRAWAEIEIFWPVALYATGTQADKFPPEFHADRAHLHRKPQPTIEQVKAAAPRYRASVCEQLPWIEDLLSDGADFLLGDAISLADFMVYLAPWFLELIDPDNTWLAEQPLTVAWMQRVAGIGHGDRHDIDANAALEIARNNDPLPLSTAAYEIPEGLALGDMVEVRPATESSPATGLLVAVDEHRLSIAYAHERVGNVHVHFPRLGYQLRPARI